MMARFSAGTNIAMKVPLHQYDATVAFYRDVVGLIVKNQADAWTVFEFGEISLWIDKVPSQSRTDIWLQLTTDNLADAIGHMLDADVPIRDELEPLEGVNGHWISDPAGTVLLVQQPKEKTDNNG
jgi:predicted enzyme related to lactoylglutathione lyase